MLLVSNVVGTTYIREQIGLILLADQCSFILYVIRLFDSSVVLTKMVTLLRSLVVIMLQIN